MKLELKHIAGYLPYKLQILDIGTDKIDTIDRFGETSSREEYAKLVLLWSKWLKPILRPMSDLIKPCLDGKTPLFELSKIEGFTNGFNKDWIVTSQEQAWAIAFKLSNGSQDVLGYDTNFGFVRHNVPAKGIDFIFHQVEMFEYLHQHHFDIHGLIDKGLAIDKNNL